MSAGPTTAALTTAAPLPVADIDAPFHDARSDQLTYSLVEPRIEPLAVTSADIRLRGPDGTACPVRVELGVLGTSHQVTVTLPGNHRARGRLLVRETLACLSPDDPRSAAASDSPVPPHRLSALATGTLEVSHTVHEPTDLSGAVAAALTRASAMEVTCAAGFPGDPDALTILGCDVRDDALVWRTWHCYPQAGEIVESRSRFVPEALL